MSPDIYIIRLSKNLVLNRSFVNLAREVNLFNLARFFLYNKYLKR